MATRGPIIVLEGLQRGRAVGKELRSIAEVVSWGTKIFILVSLLTAHILVMAEVAMVCMVDRAAGRWCMISGLRHNGAVATTG